MVFLRRVLLLVAVLGASTAGYAWWRRREESLDTGVPEWPAFPAVEATPGQSWVEPVEGACPASHPVKLNESSGIFHLPGGRFYDRTNADRCYASAEAAVADGYRASKA